MSMEPNRRRQLAEAVTLARPSQGIELPSLRHSSLVSSVPLIPAGEPEIVLDPAEVPACPPRAVLSTTRVSRPSEAP